MAINFPDNPNPNDIFTDVGKSWIWDGTTWKIYSSSSSGIGLNNLSVTTASVGTAALSYNNTTGVFTYTPPDLSGYITQQYTLPTASTTVLGGVKVDGSTITINGSGVISGANTYSLPIASTTVLGGIKVGSGLSIDGSGVLTASAGSTATNLTLTDESGDTECFPVFCGAPTNNQTPHTNLSFKFNAVTGELLAGSFKKAGGSSSEFLKADGSIDSSTYASNLNDLLDVNTTGLTNGKILKYNGTSWVIADDQSGGGGGGGSSDPVGTIVMWSGASNNLPTGYQLCDGTTPVTTELQLVVGVGNTVPDLRDRFVVGAASNYNVGDKGGSTSETVNISGSDTVNISASDNVTISGTTGAPVSSNLFGLGDVGGSNKHVHSFSGSATVNISASDTVNISGSDTVNTVPPYYALCYIIKHTSATSLSNTFTGLSDTPSSHSNDKWLKSNGSALIWTDAPSATTINDNAAERVITGSATAGELNASDKLTLASNGTMTLTGQLIVDDININDNIIQPNTTNTTLKLRGNGSGLVEVDDNLKVVGPVVIDNYAATALTIKDGSNNEKFVVDTVNGKVNIGSNAGGASGLYLFHQNFGSGTAITLDGPTGNISLMGTVDGRDVAVDGVKLDGIESGATNTAEPVNADWNATSGLEQILNKPTIPTNNNQLTNGSGYLTSTTQIKSDWNSTTGASEILNKPTLVTNINGLSDVNTGTISTNDVLQWNGSAWAAAALATGGSSLVAQVRRAIDTSTSTQYNPVGYVDKLTLTVNNVDANSKILLFFRMALGHSGSGTTQGRVIGPGTLYGGNTEFTTATGLGNISTGPTHGILWDTSSSTTREFKIQYADNGGVYSTISNCELVAIELKLS